MNINNLFFFNYLKTTNYFVVFIFIIFALILSIVLIFSYILTSSQNPDKKLSAHECGFEPYDVNDCIVIDTIIEIKLKLTLFIWAMLPNKFNYKKVCLLLALLTSILLKDSKSACLCADEISRVSENNNMNLPTSFASLNSGRLMLQGSLTDMRFGNLHKFLDPMSKMRSSTLQDLCSSDEENSTTDNDAIKNSDSDAEPQTCTSSKSLAKEQCDITLNFIKMILPFLNEELTVSQFNAFETGVTLKFVNIDPNLLKTLIEIENINELKRKLSEEELIKQVNKKIKLSD